MLYPKGDVSTADQGRIHAVTSMALLSSFALQSHFPVVEDKRCHSSPQ